MTSIVIDKSFLQGTNARRIRKLAAEHRLLMSDALLYELLTTKAKSRRECFAKLPKVSNPVDLVSHVGTLIKREIDTRKPSGPPSLNKEEIAFVFSDALTTEHYTPTSDEQSVIEEETVRLKSNVYLFLEKTEHIPSYFPDLLRGTQANRKNAHLKAEKAIVTPQALTPFLAQLKPPPGEKELPPADAITEDWAIYRWLQVQFLFALDVYVRYQGSVPKELSQKVFERIEHDVLDADLLTLGCLEGAYATQEKKHKRWWGILCPNGKLYE